MYCDCGNPVENRDTGKCGSCSQAARKAAKVKVKVVTPPKRVSEKEAKRLAEYAPIRAGQLKEHPYCQLKLQGCEGKATSVHHTKKRLGVNLTDKESLLSACDNCHYLCEFVLSAAERREKGLLK